MTLFQLWNEGTGRLERAGAPEAGEDAKRLLLAAFDLDMVHFLMRRMEDLEESEPVIRAAADYRQMIGKRCGRMPIQQILGSQDFMGLTFRVDRHVLIPRQDTETLVETVLAAERDMSVRVLDLCTGSGCIAVSLGVLGGYEDITAADVSEEAVKVAETNARWLMGEKKIRFLQGDLFEALPRGETFDILVSNPPYIPTAVIGTLHPEVKDHEPRLALDGAADGLSFYRRISAEAGTWLRHGGRVYLEIGHDQAEAVRALLEEAGFGKVKVIKDLPGKDRVVCAELDKKREGGSHV